MRVWIWLPHVVSALSMCVLSCVVCDMSCFCAVHTGGWCFRGWFSIAATKRDWADYNTHARIQREEGSQEKSDKRETMQLDVSERLIGRYRSAFCTFMLHCLTTRGTSAAGQSYHVTSLIDMRGGTRSLIRVLSAMNLCLPLTTWDRCRQKIMIKTKEKLR